jgi:1-pyrroline-5-carboxylate dehydrogenase
VDIPHWIDGKEEAGSGRKVPVVAPFEHRHVLGHLRHAGKTDAQAAVQAAKRAAPGWRDLSFDDRAAIFLRAAELLSGPWRDTVNAATMLGQAKTVTQAEIDAAVELIDFWRFNVHFASQVLAEQPPANSRGVWNRTDHRPLEGFVYAVTPFNFTAITGNLPTAPALMGNTVVWKPAPTAALAASYLMRLLIAAGLPPGVINLLNGDGAAVTETVLADPDLGGVHFTGSTRTFHLLWRGVSDNLDNYRSYPRVVGETGGKDFILAHTSADLEVLRTALVRGAFEYQGQKCSAASRAYIPRSVWRRLRKDLIEATESVAMGPTTDFSNFMSAVIDDRAFAKHKAAIDRAHSTSGLTVHAGGSYDDSTGYYVRPTIVEASDAGDEMMSTEYFGPILTVHVYPDARFEKIMDLLDSTSPYALTGAIIADDRAAAARARERLRYAAGNFYINDKPTGAVVGQQPFGGARGSGTNDKAGSAQNLMRWTSTRSIKETFDPPRDYRYPHMG